MDLVKDIPTLDRTLAMKDQNFQAVEEDILQLDQDTVQVGVGKVASAVNLVVHHPDLTPFLCKGQDEVVVDQEDHRYLVPGASASGSSSLVPHPHCYHHHYHHQIDCLMAVEA